MRSVKTIDTLFFSYAIRMLKFGIGEYRKGRELVFDTNKELFNSWSGEGKERYKNEFAMLKTKLNDEEDNLREMALMLENIRSQYQEIDKKISNDIKE